MHNFAFLRIFNPGLAREPLSTASDGRWQSSDPADRCVAPP